MSRFAHFQEVMRDGRIHIGFRDTAQHNATYGIIMHRNPTAEQLAEIAWTAENTKKEILKKEARKK